MIDNESNNRNCQKMGIPVRGESATKVHHISNEFSKHMVSQKLEARGIAMHDFTLDKASEIDVFGHEDTEFVEQHPQTFLRFRGQGEGLG